MKILKSNDVLPRGLAIALGAFDGVHIGHRKLIDNIVEYSKKNNCKSCVYTFDTLPSGARYINDWDKRIEIFEGLGVDYLYIQEFDTDFKNTSATDFLNKYIGEASYVTVGFNFCFGKGREGNTHLLNDYCNKKNIFLEIVEPVYYGNEIVSSTKIRGYIEKNNFEVARKMLGRDFCVNGTVVHGNAIGRTMDFPTANICVDENRIMPTEGVYATVTEYEGKMYPSVTNYGGKPTFKDNKILLETNLFDFEGDLYDKKITVYFLEKLRNVVRFSSKEELKIQLISDKNKSLEIFKKSLYK